MNKFPLFVFALCALMSVNVVAEQKAPFYAAYEEGREVFFSVVNKNYRLALDDIKKINGEWVSDREERIRSKVYRRTIELPASTKIADAIFRVDSFFSDQNGRRLYSCEKMDCGSSNARANNWFGIKLLYGMEQSQYYRVWEVAPRVDSDNSYFVVVYGVQRGNRRAYLQIDVLEPVEPVSSSRLATVKQVIYSLREYGYYLFTDSIVATNEYTPNKVYSQVIAQALATFPKSKVAIVGHDYGEGSLSAQVDNSEKHAEKISRALVGAGVDKNKLMIRGLGSLAPQGKQGSARVLIVLIDQ